LQSLELIVIYCRYTFTVAKLLALHNVRYYFSCISLNTVRIEKLQTRVIGKTGREEAFGGGEGVNIKMGLREIEGNDVYWIHLAQDMGKTLALVNTVMKLRVP
jgi:hypothetical protein